MSNKIQVKVPDIGGATGVEVIEILVKPGDEIVLDAPLITLESEKASMDIPATQGGKVEQINLKVGDKVSEGDNILTLISTETSQEKKVEKQEELPITLENSPQQLDEKPTTSEKKGFLHRPEDQAEGNIFASPAVRRLARELGVNLKEVIGSGEKARITKEDVQNYIKDKLKTPTSNTPFTFPAAPPIDFKKFGETEIKPLNKIKRLTGQNVHRAWLAIPQVTQFDEADITELEAFRQSELASAEKKGYKLTVLAFVTKVVSKALVLFPQFNTSLDSSGENLIYKKYINIGIAVETPNGLVVPVIQDVDKLSVKDIAVAMANLSKKAREKGLLPQEMAGGCFTISSLGGIGGTAFTPIVNSPEVAILGLSRSTIKPLYEKNVWQPRTMLPLSLSYDHRVIDGAEAARFTRCLADLLSDIRRVLL